jgi:3-hydroxyisobutyrate dehydrogenase
MASGEPLRRVAFVGLGRMGRPMAERLAAAGFVLRVFDTRAETVRGLDAAASLAAAGADRDAVITMLPDGEAVRQVVLDGSDRLLGAMRPGTLLIDMGSSNPAGTRRLGATLAAHGITMLDAPVSGGVARARAGTLAIMVGGDPAVVERCRPLFAPLAAEVFAVGPLGAGHALKALNNLVSAAGVVATAEALLVGRRFGLDAGVMLDVFNASTARSNASEHKFRQFVFSRTFASGFALSLMAKDLDTALELAETTATPVPLSAECRALWSRARSELGPDADHTEVVRWLERLAGATLTEGAA